MFMTGKLPSFFKETIEAMLKAAYSVTFHLFILEIVFLFFNNTVKILIFRYTFYLFRNNYQIISAKITAFMLKLTV